MTSQTWFVGIGGGTCAGKTTLARELGRRVADHSPLIVPLDAYYRDLSGLSALERADRNFDAPDALDWPLLLEHLDRLKAGLAVPLPSYDFSRHVRKPESTSVRPGGVVIVEGLLALFGECGRRMDVRLFLETGGETALLRRLARDTKERGRREQDVRRQFERTVRPMYDRWVRPGRERADLILSGSLSMKNAVDRAERLIRSRLQPL